MTKEPSADIITVSKLLSKEKLKIPEYQRPYKWTSKNITQLFSDIARHKDESAYRLGTIVFHQDDEEKDMNIVDGQQRTITLLLTIRALINLCKDKLKRDDLKEQLENLDANMENLNLSFTSDISKFNIHSNYLEISRIVSRSDFTEELIDFLLNQCEVVTFTLNNVSEAFQFFDSQNARGRDLEPHDLLKAYHLREFSPDNKHNEHLKASTITSWENSDTAKLASLFAQYLYRIRNWSKGNSARYFGKDDIHLFKGVNIDTVADYPYIKQLRITHHFVDDNIDGGTLDFPFHLDQIIINGRRFFEMTTHYQAKIATITDSQSLIGSVSLDGFAKDIIKTINDYPERNRTGDRYVRVMFDCLLIYYIDKFGHAELSRAIEKIFIWAYRLRLESQRLGIASMDNHVLENNLFRLIKDATHPTDFINFSLPPVTKVNSTKTEKIEELFKNIIL